MKEFIFWWLGIEAVGLAAIPLTFAFFRSLPDRGFAFSKAIGLLLLGYGVWTGAIIGVFPNSRGSVILVLAAIAAVSALIWSRNRQDMTAFVRSGWRYMLFVEGLFLVVLAGAVFIRSYAPEIQWGEKQFEMAFLNGISRSEVFPPRDPWMSGQSISYYYFGYLLIATLSKLVALSTTTTFYLGLSLMASLASISVFGLVYNLIMVSRREGRARQPVGVDLAPRAAVFGLAGAGLMAVVSNLEGVFELLARHGIGSQNFYAKVGIFGLDTTYDCHALPGDCAAWYPTRFWWWWKATRMGSGFDIQEFPFFTFQFGDLHPHLLVMPFLITILAVGLALVLSVRARRSSREPESQVLPTSLRPVVSAAVTGGMVFATVIALGSSLNVGPLHFGNVALAVLLGFIACAAQAFLGLWTGEEDGVQRLNALWWLRRPGMFILLALLAGGALFLDTWTLPLVLTMLTASALVANWLRSGGRLVTVLVDSAGFMLPLVGAMFTFYLPFHLNQELDVNGVGILYTSSPTSGTFPPEWSEVTRPLHFVLFWAPLLWMALSFLAFNVYARGRQMGRGRPVLAAAFWAAPFCVWLVWLVADGGLGAIPDEFSERGWNLITLSIIATALTLAAVSFLHEIARPARERDDGQLFAFQLATFAFVMLLGAELFYVRDLFGWRANTVFRFWHESWIMLSVVGGFGLYRLTLGWRLPTFRLNADFWPRLALGGVAFGAVYMVVVALEPWDELYAHWWSATFGLFVAGGCLLAYAVASAMQGAPLSVALPRLAWVSVTAVVLTAALVYPVTVTFERTGGFTNPQSLDGLVHVKKGNPAEYAAIQWLRKNVVGTPVIVEAVEGSYSDGGRISSRTGLPAVLGWPFHETVWHDPDGPVAEREADVRRIYETTDVEEAKRLLDKYDVEYVYVGGLERNDYGDAGLAKFAEFMTPVFEQESVTIYRMPDQPAVVSRP